MPGSIHVSVALGKREYNGSIGQEDFSFPVTTLRESMVMQLYNEDRSLISQAELKTKAVVESGTMDVVFSLDNGGSIILRLQFLLSNADRKRVQEMRNSAVKRKQQELLSDGYGLSQDIPLSKQLVENISDISSEGDQPTVWKSMSLDDLQEKAVFSATTSDLQMKDTRDSLGQSASSSAVKKMISSIESSSPQDLTRIKSESSLKVLSASSENFIESSSENSSFSSATKDVSGHTPTSLVAGTSGKAQHPSGDKSYSSRSGKHILFSNKKSDASEQQAILSGTSEGRSRRLFRENDPNNSDMVITSQNRAKKRSAPKRRRFIGPYFLEHMHPRVCITTASRQLKELLEVEPPLDLDSFVLIGKIDTKKPDVRGSIMQDQGVRVVIVIIACGAIFLNNR
uniref:Uncharacterized protein n=1 Tax=Leersia perrieri TaxID=77586 RepID=A0A0D9WE46_9ORYZ